MAAMRALVVRCSFLTDGSWYCSRNAACSGVMEIIGESPQLGVADKLLVVVDARTPEVGTRGTESGPPSLKLWRGKDWRGAPRPAQGRAGIGHGGKRCP